MNELEKYHIKLDESDYDCTSEHLINSELKEVSLQLYDKGENDLFEISELERQAFAIRKSFDKVFDQEKGTLTGLSWQAAGTRTLEDGQEEPIYWPDVMRLTDKDFKYFEKRYKEYKNLYCKTEFGLLVYFGGKTSFAKHNDFKKQLVHELFELSKKYLAKAANPDDKKHYVLYFFSSLYSAFMLAEKTKLSDELNMIIRFIYDTHQNWEIHNKKILRILLDLSELMLNYFKHFKNHVDYKKVLDKNFEGAIELEKSYIHGAIYIVDRNIEISKKINSDYNSLIRYKAELYEKLSDEAETKGNMACVTFTEDALRLYQQLNDIAKISELELRYTEQRGKFKLNKIKQELPEEYTKQIQEEIHRIVKNNNEVKVLQYLTATPWYDKIKSIERQTEESKHGVFLSTIGTAIFDKFGNTIDKFQTQEEIEKYNFWETYGFNFQIGTQTMHHFFIEAYMAKKITYSSVISHLEQSWYNDLIQRKYHGDIVEIKPIDIIKPSIKRLFEELDLFSEDNTYQLDYVTITDSLVLKTESILRYFCEKLGIATFKTNQKRAKGATNIVMEKTLDDLLVSIKHSEANPTGFDEEDRVFIKYVMTEKAGLNLRNEVAHGLMDIYEYTFPNILVVLSIILKLSKYKFTRISK